MSNSKAKRARAELRAEYVQGRWANLDRQMLTDDASWLLSLATSYPPQSNETSAIGLATLPHTARVVHEGVSLLQRQRPSQAATITEHLSEDIAYSRHTVKLLDDTKRSVEDVLETFDEIDRQHAERFVASRNLGEFTLGGRLVASSRTASYQVQWTLGEMMGNNSKHYDMSYQAGRAIQQVLAQFQSKAIQRPLSRSLSAVQIADRDRSTVYRERYGDSMRPAEGDLLSLVEASINSALHLFRHSEEEFAAPVFRARFVVLSHALSSIRQVLGVVAKGSPDALDGLRVAAHSSEADNILSLRALRNRSMHYAIPPTLEGLSLGKPVYGLVEATSPGWTADQAAVATHDLLERLSDTFASL